MRKPRFPEHVKMGRVRDKSQACADFIEWLRGKGYLIGRYHVHTDACFEKFERVDLHLVLEGEKAAVRRRTCGMSDSVLYPESINVKKLLAEFFEIDEVKLEAEKMAILDEHREDGTALKIAT